MSTCCPILVCDCEKFNTVWLINSLTCANVVLGDYLAAGNSCLVEFNILYRLHLAMNAEDTAYTGKYHLPSVIEENNLFFARGH